MNRWLAGAATAVALALPAAGLTVPAQAAPGDTNGPLLVRTAGYKSELRQLGGALVATVTSAYGESTEDGQFSPGGERIAHVRTECPDDCVSSIVVRNNEGDVEEFGPLAANITSLTWSPDGQQLAFLAYETFDDATIYRMRLDGSDPVALVSDSESFDVDDLSEISWNPAGSSIVFVGGEPEPEGYFNAVHASQLYTVSASGGPPQQFNPHFPESCSYDEAPKTCYYEFQSPEWSPDGTSVVAEVVQHVTSAQDRDERFLGTIGPGALEPTNVTDLRELELVVSSFRGPSWSPDGTQLLFQDDDEDDLYAATVNAAGGGRTRLPASLSWLFDWQPCPGGECAVWGGEPDKLPSTLTVNIATTTDRVRVNGQVTPNKAGQRVTLTLKHWVKGRWVNVTKPKAATLSAKSRYVVKLPRSRRLECKVVGKYAGDATHLPATRTVEFYC